jgi:hypothetical protein
MPASPGIMNRRPGVVGRSDRSSWPATRVSPLPGSNCSPAPIAVALAISGAEPAVTYLLLACDRRLFPCAAPALSSPMLALERCFAAVAGVPLIEANGRRWAPTAAARDRTCLSARES